jgi:hypothetical protein
MEKYNDKYENINDAEIAPLQAEKDEWIFTPQGHLVKSAATKKHNKMDSSEFTDTLPSNSYIFSNDPKMKLSKKDFEDAPIGMTLAHYQEGQKSKVPKPINFSKFFKSSKQATPAQLAKNISNTYKVLTDKDHKYNPFISRANKLNKESREKAVMFTMMANEMKKAEVAPEAQVMNSPQQPVQQFKYGGSVPKYQWGDIFGGAASGAGAGAAFGPIGAGIGAFVGGLGSWLTGSAKDKEIAKREMERKAMIAKMQGINDDSFSANNFASFAKRAVPLPKYSYLDLSSPINRVNSTYNRLMSNRDSRTSGAINRAGAYGNTMVRNLATSGLSPVQLQNVANNAMATGINNMNATSNEMDRYYDTLSREKMNQLNQYDSTLAQDTQRGENLTSDRRYNANMNFVGELGNNYQTKLGKDSQLLLDDYNTKMGLQIAGAKEKADSVGRFQNTLTTAGNTYSNIRNANAYENYLAGLTNPYTEPVTDSTTNSTVNNSSFSNLNGNIRTRFNSNTGQAEYTTDLVNWKPLSELKIGQFDTPTFRLSN